MSQLQDLRARMRLDNSQFSRGLKQARSETQAFGKQMLGLVRSFAGPLASAFSFGAIVAGARRGAQEIDQVAKSARAVGGSVGGIRAAELVLEEAGVSASVLRQELQNLNRQVANGGAADGMRMLGIETREFIRLDADQKLAMIADRIKELGLDAGSTNAVLQKFGIRNRDMALAVMQGGDAFRTARSDIEAYGLAMSSIDTARIEEANDRIGRLSIVGQYLRQELALQTTPALGQFAQAMTESMREGGALRTVIDGLVGLVPRLAAYIGAAAGGAAIYGTALAGIAAAKWLIVAASNGVRAALMRLGFPALILAAGEMIFQFTRLVRATGGWGEALEVLGRVAAGVWEGIGISAKALVPALGAVWADIQSGFFALLDSMTAGFSRFMSNFTVLADLPRFGITQPFRALGDAAVASAAAVGTFTDAANEAAGRADRLRSVASQMASAGFDRAREAVAELRDIMSAAGAEGEQFEGTMRDLYSTLDDIGGGGGGGAGGGGGGGGGGPLKNVKDGINDVRDAMEDAARAQEEWANTMAGHFDGLITGGRKASDILMSFARQLESSFWKDLFSGFGGGGGGGGGGKGLLGLGGFLGFLDGGGHVPRGMFAIAAEKRAEFVNGVLVPGPADVVGGAETARRLGQMGGGKLDIGIGFDRSMGGFTAQVMDDTGRMVASAFQEYDAQVVPVRVGQVSRDPRARGR